MTKDLMQSMPESVSTKADDDWEDELLSLITLNKDVHAVPCEDYENVAASRRCSKAAPTYCSADHKPVLLMQSAEHVADLSEDGDKVAASRSKTAPTEDSAQQAVRSEDGGQVEGSKRRSKEDEPNTIIKQSGYYAATQT